MDVKQIGEQFLETLKLSAVEMGRELKDDGQELQAYIEQRLPLVAMAITEPGFMEVMEVEGNNLLLKAGLVAVDRADAVDQRMRDMAMGALQMAVRAAVTGGV